MILLFYQFFNVGFSIPDKFSDIPPIPSQLETNFELMENYETLAQRYQYCLVQKIEEKGRADQCEVF